VEDVASAGLVDAELLHWPLLHFVAAAAAVAVK
jgi:hypothetical protein